MSTFYKPSQWRGKRLVYRSTDPEEPKREILKLITFLVVAIGGLVVVFLLSRLLN